MATPGTYTVSIAKRVDGELHDLGQSQSFDVRPLRDPAIRGAAPDDVVAFLKRVAELERTSQGAAATIRETTRRLKAIRESLMNSTVPDTTLEDEVSPAGE